MTLGKYSNGMFDENYIDGLPELYHIDFIDEQHGIAAGGQLIYKTNDSGQTWLQVFNSPENIVDISILPSGKIVAAGKSSLFISHIDSTGWVIQSTSLSALSCVDFITDSLGYAVADNSLIKTLDGGLTWNVEFIPKLYKTEHITKVYHDNEGYVYLQTNAELYSNVVRITAPVDKSDTTTTDTTTITVPVKIHFNVYPNPLQGICHITIPDDFKNENEILLEVFDEQGRRVQQQKVSINPGMTSIPLSLPETPGIYQLALSNRGKVYREKIVLE